MPAIPGMEPPIKAVCVAPQGMEEGTSVSVPDQEFGLVVGEPVEFPFLAATEKTEDEVGAVHEDWEEAGIEEGGAPRGRLQAEEDSEAQNGRSVPVRLETVATEIGTLELYCVEKDGPGRWKLEFNARTEDE